MLEQLKNHPFAVTTFFKKSIVLTFAIPKEEVQKLIPDCLTLDTYNDKWAFIAVALVETENLRPKGFPKFLGNDFFLIGYRVFVKYKNPKGKIYRGLYILKSETNKKKMEFFGNIFTHYNYSTTDITQKETVDMISYESLLSQFNFSFSNHKEAVSLPNNSPFIDWKIAKKYAGPLPFTFTVKKDEILIIEGVREKWHPKPIELLDYNFDFLNKFNFSDLKIANAFIIENIPYYWKKGKTERWK